MTTTDRAASEAQLSRNKIASAVRRKDRRAENRARADHKEFMLRQHIAQVVATAPPLRPEQLDRLRALLAPGPTTEAAARPDEQAAA